ncbi:MAG: hypothetical protein H8K08_14125 [Nitrospira sp.]|nr:hypothetical protein [Nitrospira sp.]
MSIPQCPKLDIINDNVSIRPDKGDLMSRPSSPLLIMSTIGLWLACMAGPALASTITFGFEGELVQAGGPNGLTLGDPFTGTFAYTLEQSGTSISGGGTQYVLDAFALTLLGQTVSSSGGNVRIYNQPSSNALAGDRLHLNIDPTTTTATVAGSINGAPVAEFYLALVNLSGSPFVDESLPHTLNIMNFPDLKRVDLIFSPGYGAVIGEITNVSVVPLPTAAWLFIEGLIGLGLWGVGTERLKAS